MPHNNALPGSGVNDAPTTVTPTSLLMPLGFQLPSGQSTPVTATTHSVISRPKRHVRPRATTDEEKHTRSEERKIANRNAAKHSRDRQKQAMEEAQHENDRLKQENNDLHTRLNNLEQRMRAMEMRCLDQGITSTHQPARQMLEPQCPIPRSPPATSHTQHLRTPMSICSMSHSAGSTQHLWAAVYALQILMHSFSLSITYQMPLMQFLTLQYSRQRRLRDHKRIPRSFQWMGLPGYATPNHVDLRGAIRGPMLRGRMKFVRPQQTRVKDLQRHVTRERRRGKSACIRLIVKKKSGKRMNR